MMDRRAFTLIELLVVVGILILLLSLLVGGASSSSKKARTQKAFAEVQSLWQAVNQYKADVGRFPKTIDYDCLGPLNRYKVFGSGLAAEPPIFGPYVDFKNNQVDTADGKIKLFDPWGKPYEYRKPGNPSGLAAGSRPYNTVDVGFPIVFSRGPNGNIDSSASSDGDDIGSWQ
jgi:general secretion pathway protein G